MDVNKLLQESRKNPREFINKIISKRLEIEKNLEDIKYQLKRAQYQFKILKSSDPINNISENDLQIQWSTLYQAYALYYQNKIQTSSTSKETQELSSFERNIAQKLETQTLRLQKIQQYSKKLKESYELQHEVHSTHRQKRIEEINNIYKQFIIKIKHEQARHYDERILKSKNLNHEASEQLSLLQQKSELLLKDKLKIEFLNKTLEDQIKSIKIQISENNLNDEFFKELDIKYHQKLSSIEHIKNEITYLQHKMKENDYLISAIQNFAKEVQRSISISQSIFRPSNIVSSSS